MTIRILHTGDWHLGKKLFKTSRLEEQNLFLDQLKSIILDKNINALLVSGDIFDTPYPPSDAIRLFNDFLHEVSSNTLCKVYFIAGNHDSGRFLETVTPFYNEKNIFVVGEIRDKSLEDFHFKIIGENQEEVALMMFPFFRSFDLTTLGKRFFPELETLREENIQEYLLLVLKKIYENFALKNSQYFKILMTHHLFAGYEPSDSEQGVNLSGLDHIPLGTLESHFNYVALGHIHKKQTLSESEPMVVYPGSPIPFRFSESNQKWISYLEVESETEFKQVFMPVTNHRPLLKIKTPYENLKNEIEKLKNQNKGKESLKLLLEVNVVTDKPITGIPEEIRELLKDSFIELVSYTCHIEDSTESKAKSSHKQKYLSTEELFDIFYKDKYQKDCPDDIRHEFINVLSNYRRESAYNEREGR